MIFDSNIIIKTDEVYEMIKLRVEQLELLIKEAEKRVENAPNGKISVRMTGKDRTYDQYYICDSERGQEKYITREGNEVLIGALVQKEYDAKILREAQSECKALSRILNTNKRAKIVDIYNKLPEGRKRWINPVIDCEENYVKIWLEENYVHMKFRDDMPEYYTRNGERVRSKSEVIIANILKEYGVPYKYEYPLRENEVIWARPDFTVLNIKKRKQYYWEHFGMIDDEKYANDMLKKLYNYRKHSMFEGEQLLTTYESSSEPINTRMVELLIEKYLI